MGQLVNGTWKDTHLITASDRGEFQRAASVFRNWVTADGSAGPSGSGGFKAESGRYHLYVSYACPWAHRALIFRRLKGLEEHIDVSVVHPDMFETGWTFSTDFEGATGDRQFGSEYMHQIYSRSDPSATTRVTVPVLWDKETGKIVSNESSEIIRMFNSAFNELTGNFDDYWPEAERSDIEAVNDRIYHTLNNGVYRSGFAQSQEAYEMAVTELFDTMDWLEDRLSKSRYLMGDHLTEADWRLVPTLFRFDPVYHFHFKCNIHRLRDYPNLWGFTRDLFQMPGIAETTHFSHIKRHYFGSHESINPLRIVPLGPKIDFNTPHGRGA